MLNKIYFQKSFFLTGLQKNNSNRFGIRTLELTIKVKKTSIFVKMVIYEDVHSNNIEFGFLLNITLTFVKINTLPEFDLIEIHRQKKTSFAEMMGAKTIV